MKNLAPPPYAPSTRQLKDAVQPVVNTECQRKRTEFKIISNSATIISECVYVENTSAWKII